jgi:hypothetical protein
LRVTAFGGDNSKMNGSLRAKNGSGLKYVLSVLIVGHRKNGKYGHIPERLKKARKLRRP